MIRLFTKTWVNDLEWLQLAFKTVCKFCKCPLEWMIVIEDEHMGECQSAINQSFKNRGDDIIRMRSASHNWPEAMQISQGYLRQQWIKMNAHRVMGNDFFLNWDSDVMAVREFYESDFRGKSGRPIYWFSDYNHMIMTERDPTAITAYNSRRGMAGEIYGWPISFEWMRCMPIPAFGEILRCGEASTYWPRMFEICKAGREGFSEFNLIGEFAHKFFPDAFEWRNAQKDGPTWSTGYVQKDVDTLEFQPHGIVSQGWSYGGIPDALRKWVDAL